MRAGVVGINPGGGIVWEAMFHDSRAMESPKRILGLEGGELMSMVEIAMLGKLPFTVLREAIFAGRFEELLGDLRCRDALTSFRGHAFSGLL